MLGRATYPSTQIEACRSEMALMAATWRAVAARAVPVPEAEPQVFNQMVVALEGWFVHRLRGVEGKDGNPLNEVRLLALGVTENGGHFPSDHKITWRPEASVTGYRPGDRIALSEPVFTRLATAYLNAVQTKFAATPAD
jgi:hypothetical protein